MEPWRAGGWNPGVVILASSAHPMSRTSAADGLNAARIWLYLGSKVAVILVESHKCNLLCHVRETAAVVSCYAAMASHIGPAALGWRPRSAPLPLNPLIQLLQLIVPSRFTFSPLLTAAIHSLAGLETPHSMANGNGAVRAGALTHML
jgi:hypothetical protein